MPSEVHGSREANEAKGVLELEVRELWTIKGSEALNTLADRLLYVVHT